MNAILSSRIKEDFGLVQLLSFPKGLKFIIAADKNPYFFHFDREKAVHLLDMMRFKKRYNYFDLPTTGELTKGAAESTRKPVGI